MAQCSLRIFLFFNMYMWWNMMMMNMYLFCIVLTINFFITHRWSSICSCEAQCCESEPSVKDVQSGDGTSISHSARSQPLGSHQGEAHLHCMYLLEAGGLKVSVMQVHGWIYLCLCPCPCGSLLSYWSKLLNFCCIVNKFLDFTCANPLQNERPE